jgi:hypothetical protein
MIPCGESGSGFGGGPVDGPAVGPRLKSPPHARAGTERPPRPPSCHPECHGGRAEGERRLRAGHGAELHRAPSCAPSASLPPSGPLRPGATRPAGRRPRGHRRRVTASGPRLHGRSCCPSACGRGCAPLRETGRVRPARRRRPGDDAPVPVGHPSAVTLHARQPRPLLRLKSPPHARAGTERPPRPPSCHPSKQPPRPAPRDRPGAGLAAPMILAHRGCLVGQIHRYPHKCAATWAPRR